MKGMHLKWAPIVWPRLHLPKFLCIVNDGGKDDQRSGVPCRKL